MLAYYASIICWHIPLQRCWLATCGSRQHPQICWNWPLNWAQITFGYRDKKVMFQTHSQIKESKHRALKVEIGAKNGGAKPFTRMILIWKSWDTKYGHLKMTTQLSQNSNGVFGFCRTVLFCTVKCILGTVQVYIVCAARLLEVKLHPESCLLRLLGVVSPPSPLIYAAWQLRFKTDHEEKQKLGIHLLCAIILIPQSHAQCTSKTMLNIWSPNAPQVVHLKLIFPLHLS